MTLVSSGTLAHHGGWVVMEQGGDEDLLRHHAYITFPLAVDWLSVSSLVPPYCSHIC